MKDAILFDLDGTLLPMDNKEFTECYFSLLCKKLSSHGYNAEKLMDSVWKSTYTMVKNDGRRANKEVFWENFAALMGEKTLDDIPVFDSFYTEEFNNAVKATFPTELAKKAVEEARKRADTLILATNPIFPLCGVKTRLSWIGLTVDEFDKVTTYENSYHCKPNTEYYKDIISEFKLNPKNCVMIGNDIKEDYIPASSLGMDTFLISDYIIGDISCLDNVKSGTYTDMIEYLKKL